MPEAAFAAGASFPQSGRERRHACDRVTFPVDPVSARLRLMPPSTASESRARGELR
jgi:hypothetical protein